MVNPGTPWEPSSACWPRVAIGLCVCVARPGAAPEHTLRRAPRWARPSPQEPRCDGQLPPAGLPAAKLGNLPGGDSHLQLVCSPVKGTPYPSHGGEAAFVFPASPLSSPSCFWRQLCVVHGAGHGLGLPPARLLRGSTGGAWGWGPCSPLPPAGAAAGHGQGCARGSCWVLPCQESFASASQEQVQPDRSSSPTCSCGLGSPCPLVAQHDIVPCPLLGCCEVSGEIWVTWAVSVCCAVC